MTMNELRRLIREELVLARDLKRSDDDTAGRVLDALKVAGALITGAGA